jgi:hypothetical protein
MTTGQPWKDSRVEMPKVGNVIAWNYSMGVVVVTHGMIVDGSRFEWTLIAESVPSYVQPVPPLPGCPYGHKATVVKRNAWHILCDDATNCCLFRVGPFPTNEAAESAWRRIAPHWGTV